MQTLGEWGRRIWYFLNRRRLERELEREMAAHRAELGDPRRFGSQLRLREQAADVWGWTWMDDLVRDLAYGARQLRRAPGFAVVAILTLAIGIGANTAVFTLFNAEFLIDPPVHDPGSLRTLEWRDLGGSTRSHYERGSSVPYDGFLALAGAGSLAATACTSGVQSVEVDVAGLRDIVNAQRVSGDYHRMLGLRPALGRSLTPADDRPDAPPVAVISDSLWRRVFGSDPDVVGRAFTIDDRRVTVVGVAPRGFYATPRLRDVEITMPMQMPPPSAAVDPLDNRTWRQCEPLVRLRPGIADQLAAREMALLLQRASADAPFGDGTFFPVRVSVGLDRFGRGIDELRAEDLQRAAPVLAAMTFLFAALLLIPCANIAGVMLARAVTRRREIASRLALGASRPRIVRQLLTEGLLIASIAGVLGVALCRIVLGTLSYTFRYGAPAVAHPRVLAWSTGLCLAAVAAFALAPALRATRLDLSSAMSDSGTGGTAGGRFTGGKLLTAAQVVLASVLLIGAAVQVRVLLGFLALGAAEPERLTFIDVVARRGDAESYVHEGLARLEHVPGVESVSAMSLFSRQAALCADDAVGQVWLAEVVPAYFRTARIPIVRGRDFRFDDRDVVIVNEALARQLDALETPAQRTVRMPDCGQRLTVIGVVADSANAAALGFERGNGTVPTLYLPLFSDGATRRGGGIRFLVRDVGVPPARPALVAALREVDAAVSILRPWTLAEDLDRHLRSQRALSGLLTAIGLLGLFQAAFGVYGVLALFVNRRTAEIGVRMVLGATPPDVLTLVVRQSLVPVGAGIAMTLALTPIVIGVLERASMTTPLDAGDRVLVVAPVLVLLIAALAGACAPVLRALRIAPSTALRAD